MSDDDLGTVRWFGRSWSAPVNDPRAEIATPVGEACAGCGRVFTAGDRGLSLRSSETRVAYHLACFLSEIGVTSWMVTVDD